jgi:hypothetical protein
MLLLRAGQGPVELPATIKKRGQENNRECSKEEQSEVREHAEADARGLIAKGLRKAKLKREELAKLPKEIFERRDRSASASAHELCCCVGLATKLCMGTRATLPMPASG